MLRSLRSARSAQRSPLVGVVVALGLASSPVACAYPVDDFTSASSEAGAADAPPLNDPRPDSPRTDSSVGSDDGASSATSTGGSDDPSSSSGGSSSDDSHDGSSHDHDHGKKKGGDR